MREAVLHVFEPAHPADTAAFAQAMAGGSIDPREIVLVLGKTEGNGLDNDFTRQYATDAVAAAIGRAAGETPEAVQGRATLLFSGGCEGVATPHMTVFCVREQASAGARPGGLAVGRARSRPIEPDQIGGIGQVHATAEAVLEAMRAAAIERAEDVAYIVAKAAIVTPARVAEAKAKGLDLAITDAHASKSPARGATGLGAALALGEVDEGEIARVLNRDFERYCTRLCATPAIDVAGSEVFVFGRSSAWAGEFAVGSGVLADLADGAGLVKALRAAGIDDPVPLAASASERIVTTVVKAMPSGDDRIRGHRHTMWHDSDVHAFRHYRAAISGLIAGITGSPRVYAAAGAEHHGPPGGGTIAVFARRAPLQLPGTMPGGRCST